MNIGETIRVFPHEEKKSKTAENVRGHGKQKINLCISQSGQELENYSDGNLQVNKLQSCSHFNVTGRRSGISSE